MKFQTWTRNVSYKTMRTWYAGLVPPKAPGVPYDHIVQIGDPTLRQVSEKVPADRVRSPEIKTLIDKLKRAMRKYDCVGVSAAQIGVPLQIFVIEFNKKHAKVYSKAEFSNMEMELFPQTVVVNPEIKIEDYTKIVLPEACGSVRGLFAEVPRYRSVELKGLDENGEPLQLKAKGWLARIIQHEMDHISGILYTDIMDRKSLTCSCWNIVNERGGRVELPYGPNK